MKTIKQFFLITIVLVMPLSIYAQKDESTYYERLYYTCKAWGHAKYYHSEIASGAINWDDALLNAINGIKTAPDNQSFNDSLLLMLQQAGESQRGNIGLPIVPDSLNNNIDLSWMYAPIFSLPVSELLDTIMQRFTYRPNVYVGVVYGAGNPNFQGYDDQYYSGTQYPDEGKRILALFRYWNIIHYFFPYKHIMDQEWEISLQQAIPKVLNATNALQFHLAMREFTAKINDSHAFMYSSTLNYWSGQYYTPFHARFIEGQVVITKVLSSASMLKPGDIIKKIDDFDINILRDSLTKYSHGSNDITVERNLIDYILFGNYGTFSLTVETETGLHTFDLIRNANYNNVTADNTPEWRTIICNDTTYGIIHMGNLTDAHFPEIISKIHAVDAVIFDIRNYPNGTLFTFVNYLFDHPIHIAKFTKPNAQYPGTFYWHNETIGQSHPNPLQKKVVILFDERTQSHAEYTCMGLEQLPGAIKIGSTTAAADGNVSLIYLPGSITTYATFLGTYYPDYTPTQRVGIIPDYEVRPTIQGIREGRDELLEFAMNCSLPPTGIDNDADDKSISIYPNPTNDKFTVLVDGIVSIKLYSMLGQEVLTHSATGNAVVDISHLPNGIYIVKIIKDGKLEHNGKIVKQ